MNSELKMNNNQLNSIQADLLYYDFSDKKKTRRKKRRGETNNIKRTTTADLA